MTSRCGLVLVLATSACAAKAPTHSTVVEPKVLHTPGTAGAPAPDEACPSEPSTLPARHLVVEHEDKVTSLELIHATYLLDGQTILERGKPGTPAIGDLSNATVYDADVPAGCHVMVVLLDYFTRHPTPWGYDYVLKVRSSHALTLGGKVKLTSIDSRGGITTPIEKRFAVTWDEGH